MKLGLSEVQQREICRVMLQCTGNVSSTNKNKRLRVIKSLDQLAKIGKNVQPILHAC